MINEQSETQYSKVATQAYLYALDKKMKPFDAWRKAAEEIITMQTTRDKGCPCATFIGLCESGDLVSIDKTIQNGSHNYLYAKFAVKEWKKDNAISKAAMWSKIREQFPDGAANHQGQLDVVNGIWKYIR